MVKLLIVLFSVISTAGETEGSAKPNLFGLVVALTNDFSGAKPSRFSFLYCVIPSLSRELTRTELAEYLSLKP